MGWLRDRYRRLVIVNSGEGRMDGPVADASETNRGMRVGPWGAHSRVVFAGLNHVIPPTPEFVSDCRLLIFDGMHYASNSQETAHTWLNMARLEIARDVQRPCGDLANYGAFMGFTVECNKADLTRIRSIVNAKLMLMSIKVTPHAPRTIGGPPAAREGQSL